MGELTTPLDFPRYCDRCGRELLKRSDAQRVKYTRCSDGEVTYAWECKGDECLPLPYCDANGYVP